MLESMTSRQVADWVAFGKLEQIGADVPPDPDQVKQVKNKQQRAKVEGGLRALKDKRG